MGISEQHQAISQTDPTDFARLEQAVLDRPEDEQGLHRYFQAAVEKNRIDSARATFDRLQRQYPGDHRIRGLRIGLCLHQKDYGAAMTAIETLTAFSMPDEPLIASALQVRARLGPRTPETADPARQSLSLCMIVKNEQSYLGPCLNAVKGLADEIIVVDTGSTDRSADLATLYGAHVFTFQWSNDFSAARNFALQKATCDWVLILDADEIISAKDQSLIKDQIVRSSDGSEAFSFETRNYTNLANGLNWQANDGSYPENEAGIGWFPSTKVRMFPRSKAIRFHYPVHELVEPALKKAGISISHCPIPIHHYGNLNEQRIKRKAEQYFALGYAKLDQMGNDAVALRELAIQAGQIGRWTESIALWHRFLSICPADGEAYANLAGACWQTRAYEKGIAFAEQAIDNAPGLKEGHFNLAANLLMTGRAQKAAALLQKVTEAYPDYMAARFLLAVAHTLLGKDDQSIPIFKQLIRQLSKEGLDVALGEIIKKFRSRGCDEEGDILTQTARRIRGGQIGSLQL